MTDSTWPNEPQCRKTVLVLNQQDIDALRFEEGGADLLLNEEVYILPSSLKESNPVVQDLVDSGLVRPGTVLIQSPFDKNRYENSMQAVERFALEKHLHFSTLCMYLGAREVTVEQAKYKYTEDKKIVSIQVDLPMKGSGNSKIEDEELASLCSKMTLHNEFQGGSPDVPAAEEHLKRIGLSGDTVMRALIELRRNPNNLLTSQKLQLDMTSEVKSNFKVLANLNVPAYISLEADRNRHVREQTEFNLTVKVDF